MYVHGCALSWNKHLVDATRTKRFALIRIVQTPQQLRQLKEVLSVNSEHLQCRSKYLNNMVLTLNKRTDSVLSFKSDYDRVFRILSLHYS